MNHQEHTSGTWKYNKGMGARCFGSIGGNLFDLGEPIKTFLNNHDEIIYIISAHIDFMINKCNQPCVIIQLVQ